MKGFGILSPVREYRSGMKGSAMKGSAMKGSGMEGSGMLGA
jgi:hypothetical protein